MSVPKPASPSKEAAAGNSDNRGKTRTAKKGKEEPTVTMVLDDPNTTGNTKEGKRKGSLSDTQQTSKRAREETKQNLKLISKKGKQYDASTDEDTTF